MPKESQTKHFNLESNELLIHIEPKTRTQKNNSTKEYSKIINHILSLFILFILPQKVFLLSDHYIKMKFSKVGYNQILSDEYLGFLPDKIIKGDEIMYMDKNKIVFIDSIDTEIILEFNSSFTNFSYMFSNLTTISSIHISHMFGKYTNTSFMFYNCYNLQNVSYDTKRNDNFMRDMRGMFYNCLSLKSFYFHDLYIDQYYSNGYYYYDVNISYMFYNCQNLDSVSFDSNNYFYIGDMTAMFYNCYSLNYIDLRKIYIRNYINISYLFYNCKKLASFDCYQFQA